jgi:O-antigen ligase
VSLLAFFQAFLITPETLEKIGYTAATINPRQIIDGSINFLRSFSTLGGPNQLGAYLLIPLAFSLVYGIRQKKWFVLLPSMLILAAIVLSFSRSAWIGAIITFSLSVFLSISKKQKIYFLIISLLVAFIVGGTIASQIGTNERLQNVLLHGRVFEGRIEGSDQGRLESIARIAGEVTARPFGHGLGSAGPASFRSENPIIPENWFLQIGYEIGIAGLLLYIFAFAALLGEFIRNRSNNLAITLFSITAGVLVINIFLQAWADSTLALMMFALYGIYRSNNK